VTLVGKFVNDALEVFYIDYPCIAQVDVETDTLNPGVCMLFSVG
jgi:hypothetical protein